MIFHGIDGSRRRLGRGPEDFVTRCLAGEYCFRVGDTARSVLGAADANTGIRDQSTIQPVGN